MFFIFITLSLLLRAVGAANAATRVDSRFVRRESELLETDHRVVKHTALAESDRIGPSGSSDSGCTTNQVAYAVMSDNTLMLIDMGPTTPSGKTEVRRMRAANNYTQYVDDNPLMTRMHLSAGANSNGDWTFLTDSGDNLVAINSGATESDKVELHRLKWDHNSPYQEFDMHSLTASPRKSGWSEWDFLFDSQDNLLIIKRGPSTSSGNTEVHTLSVAQAYAQFDETMPIIQTVLPESASTSNNGDWAFVMPRDGTNDLIAIKRPTQWDNTATILKLTQSSKYAKASNCCPTLNSQNIAECCDSVTMPQTSSGSAHWVFAIDSSADILCIKEGPSTKHGFTEIHRLSAAHNYTKFNGHFNRTAAPCRQPHFVDAAGDR
jgi:hypothetical protein